jgi:DMSO/TMAO reductase YedYZ heme-binding membrane subunit
MEYDFQKTFFILEHFKALDIISGLIGLAIIIVLGVTSNNFSVNKLKAYWGKIQSLTYPLFVIVALHVAFASRFETFYILVITVLVYARTHAYFKNAKNGGK